MFLGYLLIPITCKQQTLDNTDQTTLSLCQTERQLLPGTVNAVPKLQDEADAGLSESS